MQARRVPTLTGQAELTSPWFSSRWRLSQGGSMVGELHRLARCYSTTADLGEHGRLVLEPCGDGTVHALDEVDNEVARITRRSWLGRRWEISGIGTGLGYEYDLISDPRPRRWHIQLANAVVSRLEGSLVSYNHVRIRCDLALPIPAVLLAWHVIARPWEAMAEPRGLVPVSTARLEP